MPLQAPNTALKLLALIQCINSSQHYSSEIVKIWAASFRKMLQLSCTFLQDNALANSRIHLSSPSRRRPRNTASRSASRSGDTLARRPNRYAIPSIELPECARAKGYCGKIVPKRDLCFLCRSESCSLPLRHGRRGCVFRCTFSLPSASCLSLKKRHR